MKGRKFKIFFLTFTLLLFLACLSGIYAGNSTGSDNVDNSIGVYKSVNDNNIKTSTSKAYKMNVSVNKISETYYPNNTTVTGKISTEDKKLPDKNNVHLYVNNKKQSNDNFLLENNGTFKYTTKQTIGNHTLKIYINDTKYEKKTVTANFTIKDKIIPLLDKSRPIYFAMDHTNSKDRQICNNIVQKLKQEGFKVLRYRIGPNEMYMNMVYLYNHNIHNAIMFHLFNGVDPSNIREVAVNGNDNRGRIVRKRGNDVVLAWFYDASDPIHVGGNCYYSVRPSETGPRLYNPKSYMDKNKIIYICTSSDHFKHKSTADYNGDKTALEFMKLFSTDSNLKYKTTTRASVSLTDDYLITINGTVKYPTSTINGYVTIKNKNNKILKDNVPVTNNKFKTQFNLYNVGKQELTVTYKESALYASSNTRVTATISVKNITINAHQEGNIIENNSVNITLIESNTKELLADQRVSITYDGKTRDYYTDKNGNILADLNVKKNQTITIKTYHDDVLLNSSKVNMRVFKEFVKIKVDKVRGTIGEKILFSATVTGVNGEPVNGGSIIFKLDGHSLKKDNNVNSKKGVLKLNVVNGSVSHILPAKLYMRNYSNLSASYIGTNRYNSSISRNVRIVILKRKVSVNLTVSPTVQSHYNEIVFTAKVVDVTVNSTCNGSVNQNAYIIFKLDNVPLTNSSGNVVKVKVKNNQAKYTYTVPAGSMCLNRDNTLKNYVVCAEYVNDNYYSTKKKAVFHLKRSNVSILFKQVKVSNNFLSINAFIKDFKGKNVVGNSIISLKINGNFLKNSKNCTLNFTVCDGMIDLSGIPLSSNVTVRSVTIICSAGQSYLGGRNVTTFIKE